MKMEIWLLLINVQHKILNGQFVNKRKNIYIVYSEYNLRFIIM